MKTFMTAVVVVALGGVFGCGDRLEPRAASDPAQAKGGITVSGFGLDLIQNHTNDTDEAVPIADGLLDTEAED